MATARPQPQAANPDRADLCKLISRLARRHRLGTVGLVGADAAGIGDAIGPLELFVTVAFEKVEHFARELAIATERAVYLYAFCLVPWAHPHHLCVRWLNVDQIPTIACPRGAVMRWKMTRNGLTFEAAVRLESLPHFRAVDGYVPTPAGEFVRVFSPPPLGGFLL